MIRVTLGVLVAASTMALMPRDALAGTVEVFPGNGTLQAAINAAPEGSRLDAAPGGVQRRGRGRDQVQRRSNVCTTPRTTADVSIHAQCAAPIALDIAADKVIVKMSKKKILGAGGGPLAIARGMTTGVRIANHTNVKLSRVQSSTVISGSLAELSKSGSRSVVRARASSSTRPTSGGSGGGRPHHRSTARVEVGIQRMQTSVGLNQIGLLIENSSVGAVLGKGGISGQAEHSAGGGLERHGGPARELGSGARFTKNLTFVNLSPEVALTGYSLDSGSDHNLFLTNTWSDSEANAHLRCPERHRQLRQGQQLRRSCLSLGSVQRHG